MSTKQKEEFSEVEKSYEMAKTLLVTHAMNMRQASTVEPPDDEFVALVEKSFHEAVKFFVADVKSATEDEYSKFKEDRYAERRYGIKLSDYSWMKLANG